MPKDPTFGNAAVDAETNAVAALVSGGYLRWYTAPKPATPDVAISTQTLLVELRWGAPAFGPSVGGRAEATPLAPTTVLATDAVAWFRALAPDGTTGVFDGTVGSVPGDFDITVDNVNLQVGAQITLTGFTYANPKRVGG